MIKKYHVSKNLFDKSTALANKAISDSSGNTFNYNGLNASDYINVSGMAKVSITDTGASRWGAFYDTNKGFISGFNGYGTINVPQNAIYMRITVTDAFLDSCMVNEGTTLLPYEPFVSDNLFNEIYPNIDSSLHYTAIYVGDGQFTMSTTCPRNQSGACLFFLAGNVSSGASTESNGVWGYSGTSYGTITRTQTAVNGYVTIAYRSLTTDLNPVNEDTMVNIGSTAKPYTPYGTAWIDIPYRKYGTETETFTTLPHEVIGDGTAISAWSMKGNMSQSGTPTPSNPVYPTEVGEKTANLSPSNEFSNSITDTRNFIKPQIRTRYLGVEQQVINFDNITTTGEVSLTFTINTQNDYVRFQHSGASRNIPIWVIETGGLPEGQYTLSFFVEGYDTTEAGGLILKKIMLNTGSSALPFEPSGMYKIPISFDSNTYTFYLSEPLRKISNYADTAPSTGIANRIIYKRVFTGQEAWEKGATSGNVNRYNPDPNINDGIPLTAAISTHFKWAGFNASSGNDGEMTGTSSSSAYRIWLWSTISTVTDFKQYLADQYAAGTPVTVWYVLATATTESFTAPSIPTSGSPQSFDVGTTLKPSEVSLTYHGWHEHQDTKFTT